MLLLTHSPFLWVGNTPHLRNLAMVMCTRYDPIPVSTALLGGTSDTTSTGLTQRLARKTSKQVFVSYSLPNTDKQLRVTGRKQDQGRNGGFSGEVLAQAAART